MSGDGSRFRPAIHRPPGDRLSEAAVSAMRRRLNRGEIENMTNDRAQIDALGDHRYAITVREGEDLVRIELYADPATVGKIATDHLDERRLVEQTFCYLVRRQRADDLPPTLDLADVAAGYDTWVDDMR